MLVRPITCFGHVIMRITRFIMSACLAMSFGGAAAANRFIEFPVRPVFKDQATWISQTKKVVQTRLASEGSAEFRGVYVHRTAAGAPFTCGQVRIRNGNKPPGPYRRFISGGRQEVTFLEGKVRHFSSGWRTYCGG